MMSQMMCEFVYLGVVEVSVGFVLYLVMRGE
jgi:hypothetical protein